MTKTQLHQQLKNLKSWRVILMKVLLTGSNGQLGFSIKKLTPKGIQLLSLDKNQFDL